MRASASATAPRSSSGNIETGEGLDGREFDAIVGVSVLHHVELDACFAHTFPVLRPGGRFAFSEPNLANPQVWAERSFELVRRARHVTAARDRLSGG